MNDLKKSNMNTPSYHEGDVVLCLLYVQCEEEEEGIGESTTTYIYLGRRRKAGRQPIWKTVGTPLL